MRRRSCLAALVACLLAGCGGTPQMPTLTLSEIYRRAVEDARVTEVNEVSHRLTAVAPGNPSLRWRTSDGRREVLMATWTSWAGYDAQVGGQTVLTREVWVTAAGHLRAYLAERGAVGDRVLRAKQALGLPAESVKTRFVEFWCAPPDLFRPALDPDITTTTSGPETPGWDLPRTLTPAYRAWYADLRDRSYGPGGYPWTRLGYTYDWADPHHEEGLSEFVIRPGARVAVAAARSNEAYLN